MDEPAPAVGQDGEGVRRRSAPLGMHAVEGQPRGAGDVQPMELACDTHPALVHMQHRRLAQLPHQRRLKGGQMPGHPQIVGHDRARAQGLAEQVLAKLAQPIMGQQLLLAQIDRQGFEVRSILVTSNRSGGKSNTCRRSQPCTGSSRNDTPRH